MAQGVYDRLPWFLKPAAREIYQKLWPTRFSKLKHECNGMLSEEVYEELYKSAKATQDGNIIEVGAAHGAGSIALALGLADSNSNGEVITVEKGEGGSRSKYGAKEDNIGILEQNIREWGVADRVQVVTQHLDRDSELPPAISGELPVSVLCLDADGNLDRDFELFYDHLLPGATVIIDDYSPEKNYRPKSERYPLGGGKNYRTFCHANLLVDEGYLSRYRLIDDTLFAVKPYTDPEYDLDTTVVDQHLAKTRERLTDG
ncbi:class I SAM-dependent methyltransferase [Halosimplex sp. J119]